jgi:hypothetical protein
MGDIIQVLINEKPRDVPIILPEIVELPEGGNALSVISSQRGIAKMEFYHRARIIRRDVTEMSRIDFGTHSHNQPSYFNREPTENDIILLKEFAVNMRNAAREMIYNIVKANSIYPYVEKERDKRRILQDLAIGCCEIMYQEFTYCVDTFHVRPSIFESLVEKLNIEIELLKVWRKQTNQMLKENKQKRVN